MYASSRRQYKGTPLCFNDSSIFLTNALAEGYAYDGQSTKMTPRKPKRKKQEPMQAKTT